MSINLELPFGANKIKFKFQAQVQVEQRSKNITMEKAKKFDLEDRLVAFAAGTSIFVRKFPNDFSGKYYAHQLIRSGGSSALNFGEAQGTQTTKDYISKASIVLKELKETRVNLKIVSKLNYGNQNELLRLLNETEELIKIGCIDFRARRSDDKY